ncbi:hypothetical protein CHU95_10705 [Niveispirillum lacus]|uniref:Uncharacterized protein n=1 Tax=Niveispirillum lacus TaxID=1981099 RepID=A0A255YZ56_9PROT|nr:hypothetical protein [Niveispirillum lacus]OYQ34488.1 hypothetical protein CHU95_10705 [Niveispirillum lacus]
MTGAAPYQTMMARRLAYLVAYGLACDKAGKQLPVNWVAVGTTLDAWAVAVNAALVGAQEHAAAHGGYRDLLTKAAKLLLTLEEEDLTDREMYKNLAVARTGYLTACETVRSRQQSSDRQ